MFLERGKMPMVPHLEVTLECSLGMFCTLVWKKKYTYFFIAKVYILFTQRGVYEP